MARVIGKDCCVEGQEKIRVIPNEGSSKDVIELDKQEVVCKFCWNPIKEDHAKQANCKHDIFLVHTNCEDDWYQSKYNECPQCVETPRTRSVKLIPVPVPTEKKKSKWFAFFKKADR